MLSTTSTIAFKYKDGIIIAADTQVTQGSLATTHMNRMFVINNTIITFNGMVGDFLYVKKCLEAELETDKNYVDCRGIFKFLQLFIYGYRSQTNPKFCSIVVSGIDKNKQKFLGAITSKGVFWEDSTIATGFASHFSLPLLRSLDLNNMSLQDAEKTMGDALKVLVYKDAKASNKVQLGVITNDGEVLVRNETVATNWDVSHKLNEIRL